MMARLLDVAVPEKIPAKTGSLWHGNFTVAHMAEQEFEFDVLPAGRLTDHRQVHFHPAFVFARLRHLVRGYDVRIGGQEP